MNSDSNMDEYARKGEIKPDISVPQGFVARMKEALDDSGPPTEKLEKEMEKAFKKSCGDLENSQPPECELNQEISTDVKNEEGKENDILLRSNLNPLSAEFVPIPCLEIGTNSEPKARKTGAVKKKREKENVAVRATLQDAEMKSPVKQRPIQPSPTNMFRRNNSLNAEKKSASLERKLFNLSSSQSDPSVGNSQYTPEANIYYNTYMAMTKIRYNYAISQYIWLPIEEDMIRREEEVMRRRRYCTCAYELSGEVSPKCCYKCDNGLHGSVALEFPRHSLLNNVEDCVVCSTTKKHGYSVDEKSL